MNSIPIINESILSPSGRVSKRGREAAINQLTKTLFPKGLASPQAIQPSRKETLLREAKELRALADRGMKPRTFVKQATRLEYEANKL